MEKIHLNRFWTTSIKIILSVLGLAFVYFKIDFSEVEKVFSNIFWIPLLTAFVCYNISKVISSFRLSLFLRDAGVRITPIANLKLYYVGMFYNLFLPGGIGGDGYKIFLLTRNSDVGWKKITQAIILDRISGAIALLFLIFILAFPLVGIVMPSFSFIKIFLAISAAGLYILYFLILRRFYISFLPSFYTSTIYGLVVQLIQVITAWLILVSLGITNSISLYILVFLISSLASNIPITIGGIGIREMVFVLAATYLPFSKEHAVTFSLLFFLITAASSLTGILFTVKTEQTSAGSVLKN